MIQISFKGDTVEMVAVEARSFADSVLQKFQVAEAPSTLPEKNKPGRPANPLSKRGKELAAKKVAKTSTPTKKQEAATSDDPFSLSANSNLMPGKVVGAAGIEPAEEIAPQVEESEGVEVTKETLVERLQMVCEQEDKTAGNKIAGINKVREIFKKFNVQKLGELPEAQYPALYQHVNEVLSQNV